MESGQSSAASNVTVGGFIAFIGAMFMLIAPVWRLSEVVHPITRSLAALERGLDLLDSVPPEAAPAAPITPPPRVRGEITLQNVRVAYPNAEAPAYIYDRSMRTLGYAGRLKEMGIDSHELKSNDTEGALLLLHRV